MVGVLSPKSWSMTLHLREPHKLWTGRFILRRAVWIGCLDTWLSRTKTFQRNERGLRPILSFPGSCSVQGQKAYLGAVSGVWWGQTMVLHRRIAMCTRACLELQKHFPGRIHVSFKVLKTSLKKYAARKAIIAALNPCWNKIWNKN